jgi:putative membrane protein
MLWIKALHLLFVMAWLAGLFYLPRIFVHYVEGQARGEDTRRLVVMARRLFGFMTLMGTVALCLGLWLWLGYGDTGRWLMVKLVFVLGLLGYHLACGVMRARIARGAPMPSSFALRLFNEGALVLIVPIVLLAVVKPF